MVEEALAALNGQGEGTRLWLDVDMSVPRQEAAR